MIAKILIGFVCCRYFWPKPGVLQIKSVRADDAGQYWCTGYNNVTQEYSNSSSRYLNVTVGELHPSNNLYGAMFTSYHRNDREENVSSLSDKNRQEAYEELFPLAKHNQSERAANYTAALTTDLVPLDSFPIGSGDNAGKANNLEGSDDHYKVSDLHGVNTSPNRIPISRSTSRTGFSKEAGLLAVAVKETIPTGSPAVLECITNTNTDLKYNGLHWSRADNRSLDKNRVQRRGQGSLVWSSVSRDDAGVYICSWPCDPEGERCPNPLKSMIFWYRNGQRICHDGAHLFDTTTTADTITSLLEIFYSTLNDKGVYQCFFVTKLGEVSASGYVDVIQSPDAVAPHNLQIRDVTSTSVSVQFEYVGDRRTGRGVAFIVFYGVEKDSIGLAEGECEEDDYSSDRDVNQRYMQQVATETYFSVDNLQPYTKYSFFVRSVLYDSAKNSDVLKDTNFLSDINNYLSEPSDVQTVRTRADIPKHIPKLHLEKLSTSTLHVQWTKLTVAEASGEVKQQRIQWRRTNDNGLPNVETLGPDVQAYNITGLIPEAEYEVIVEARTVEYPVKEGNWTKVVMVMDEALHLTVMADKPEQMMVYITVMPGFHPHVLRYDVDVRCSNGFGMKEKLPASSPRLPVPRLEPGTCCTVNAEALDISRDRDDFKAKKLLCNTMPSSHRPANTTCVNNIQIKWLSGTEIEVSWRVLVHLDHDQYFAMYLQRLGPVYPHQIEKTQSVGELRAGQWNRLVTATRARVTGLCTGHRYRVDVQLCTPFFCTLPTASTQFLALNAVSSPPQDVVWSSLSTSAILLRWRPPLLSREQFQDYLISYSSVYSDKQVIRVNASQHQYELKQLISNTAYNVSISAVSSDHALGQAANITFVITAYLQTSDINWTLYVLITVVTVEGVALFFYLCMLHRRGLLTTQRLSMIFSGRKKPIAGTALSSSHDHQLPSRHCCSCKGIIMPNGSNSFSKNSIEWDYPLDSKPEIQRGEVGMGVGTAEEVTGGLVRHSVGWARGILRWSFLSQSQEELERDLRMLSLLRALSHIVLYVRGEGKMGSKVIPRILEDRQCARSVPSQMTCDGIGGCRR
ncbi:Immunoglobulin [Trinorchestia longiramus]|nr:Immunoglobulin [Trinorchestia longiramus]